MAKQTQLQNIDPDVIQPNPENPRLIFHEDEMIRLLESIRKVGIKVPLSVYVDEGMYTILDGERRWRCAKRLNLKLVPVVVQPKPSPLENLLMMFNIHNVRVQWDLMPMALKLAKVKEMLESENKAAGQKDLSAITGVHLTTVKRAFTLLNLPAKYRDMLIQEAYKPRTQQRIKPDLFLEIDKSLQTVKRYMPYLTHAVPDTEYVDAFVQKYEKGIIDSVTDFREISKIARAERAGVDTDDVAPVIIRLVQDNNYTIQQAFKDTVQKAYEQRDLTTKVKGLSTTLTEFKRKGLNAEVREVLAQLRAEIDRLLR